MIVFGTRQSRGFAVAAIAVALAFLASVTHAEIDGSGPDAWRVMGVAPNDVLNVRMGPGTNYPVIETFAHNERNLQQITCVPFYTMAHFSAMTEAELDALPPRWCLMRTADLTKAGWVAQRFLIADFDDEVLYGNGGANGEPEAVDVEKILPAPRPARRRGRTTTWSNTRKRSLRRSMPMMTLPRESAIAIRPRPMCFSPPTSGTRCGPARPARIFSLARRISRAAFLSRCRIPISPCSGA